METREKKIYDIAFLNGFTGGITEVRRVRIGSPLSNDDNFLTFITEKNEFIYISKADLRFMVPAENEFPHININTHTIDWIKGEEPREARMWKIKEGEEIGKGLWIESNFSPNFLINLNRIQEFSYTRTRGKEKEDFSHFFYDNGFCRAGVSSIMEDSILKIKERWERRR